MKLETRNYEVMTTAMDWEKLANNYLADNLPFGVLVIDSSGLIRIWNRWLEENSGRPAEKVLGRPFQEIVDGVPGQRAVSAFRQVRETGQVMILSQQFHHYLIPLPSAESHLAFPVMQQSVQIAPLYQNDVIVGSIALIEDVTPRVAREQELKQEIEEVEALNHILQKREKEIILAKEEWERTFESVPDLIAIIDRNHRILRVNKAMADRLGIRREEAVGVHCFDAVHGTSAPPPFCPHAELLKTEESHTIEVYEERLKGYFQITVTPLVDEAGSISGSVHVAHDISERKRLTDILQRLSYLDGLTGIANRRKFDEFLDQEWRRALRDPAPFSLIMIDIDCFKDYNDRYGHQAGDDCLKKIAETLMETLNRPADLVARFGGEEFTAVLPDTPLEGAQGLADAMRARVEALQIPHLSSPVASVVTISSGVAALKPTQASTPEDLIRAADQALYRAKSEGRNRVVVSEE